MPFQLEDLSPSNPPSLSRQLRYQTNQLLSKIVRANYKSQFAQTAPEVTDFRHATAGHVDEMDDDVLSKSFQRTVQFTTYDSYASYIAKCFEKPCRASAIVGLLAPGLPDFLARSSSTSGGVPKTLPKYNRMAKFKTSNVKPCAASDPLRRRTKAHIFWLVLDRIEVVDEDDHPITTIYLGSISAGAERVYLHLDPERDEENMGTIVSNHVAPCAVGLVKKWRSFLLIHALFAVGCRSLETMNMLFIGTFVEMMRCLDTEFDMVVDCIANGTIPDLEGTAEVRHHLESNIFPDPERAEELRALGRPTSLAGWCDRVWPKLRSIRAVASGSFALSLPLARRFLGPNTEIHALYYGSTETWIGWPYNPVELNLFKLDSIDLVEFLDVNKTDSISSLAQCWEVERGKRYEIVTTTHDGLWRYRLGDVVEISGFDPTDGAPILQFIERRNVVIRFPDFTVTEKELRAAISLSLSPAMLTELVNWTTATDARLVPATIGFFVELGDDQVSGSDLALVSDRLLDELSRSNQMIARTVARGAFRKPTVWLVRPGTFSDFLRLKYEEGRSNLGQVKVPVVLPKPAYVIWFSERVVQEFGVRS